MSGLEYYVDRKNRDARAADLKSRGVSFTKRSARRVVLSPSAVDDYTGSISPNGFGGASSQWFPVLYVLEY